MELNHNFVIQDFVPHEIFQRFKRKSVRFINKDLIKMAESILDRFGQKPMINNWYNKQDQDYYYNYSGYRPPLCKIGSYLSRHKQSLAIDIKLKGIQPQELEIDIINNYNKYYSNSGITTIQTGNKHHVHLSCEFTLNSELNIIKPWKP